MPSGTRQETNGIIPLSRGLARQGLGLGGILFLVLGSQFLVRVHPLCAAPVGTDESALIKQAHGAILPALVEVSIPVLEDRTTPPEERTSLDLQFDRFVRQRVPVRLAGVRTTPEGTVLVRDPSLPLRRYGAVEFIYPGGVSVPARVAAVLENHAGILFEPMDPPAEPLPHVTFAQPDIHAGDPLLVAYPTFVEKLLSLDVEKIHATAMAIQHRKRSATSIWREDLDYIVLLKATSRSTAPIVLNGRAQVLGVALDNTLWSAANGMDSWVGTTIMADQRLTPETLEQTADRIRARARHAVKEIEIQFRKDSRIPQRIRTEKGKLYLYGVLVDDQGGIFAPTTLDRDAVRQIDRILVRGEEKPITATFEGLYRDLGAFLVRAKGVSGKPEVVLEGATLPRGRVFYSLSVRRRYGRRYDEVEYNRYLDMATGYKEAHYPLPMKPLRVGDIVTDADGRLLGFHAPLRKEEQDEIRARTGSASESRPQARVYLFSEIADILKTPKGHFDTAARPMTRKEEHAMVWLGIEYQPMTAPLARMLQADGPTRGGARGLLVTRVYKSSPAARLGIRTGHILLAVAVPGTAAEIDLAQPGMRRFRSPRISYNRRSGYSLWRSRRNYLTAVLTLLGEGRQVRLHVFRDNKSEVIPLTLERAPDDFDNADRYEDEDLGLTVRQITYEVRSILRLLPKAPGVVVSKVQPGSKAAVARIRPYELIMRVNGKPVSSPAEFERLVHKAAHRERVEFLVQNLGQSRIVELDLSRGDW